MFTCYTWQPLPVTHDRTYLPIPVNPYLPIPGNPYLPIPGEYYLANLLAIPGHPYLPNLVTLTCQTWPSLPIIPDNPYLPYLADCWESHPGLKWLSKKNLAKTELLPLWGSDYTEQFSGGNIWLAWWCQLCVNKLSPPCSGNEWCVACLASRPPEHMA